MVYRQTCSWGLDFKAFVRRIRGLGRISSKFRTKCFIRHEVCIVYISVSQTETCAGYFATLPMSMLFGVLNESSAALAVRVAKETTPQDSPLFDARHLNQITLALLPPYLSEPQLLYTPVQGRPAPRKQPLAPVDMKLGLQSPHEVRRVSLFWAIY